MTLELMRAFLGWCTILNVALMVFWFLFFCLGHDLMYRFHTKMFDLTKESFDAIHYGGMAVFKIAIFMLNLVPYLVLSMLI